jgi:hypothetical protein
MLNRKCLTQFQHDPLTAPPLLVALPFPSPLTDAEQHRISRKAAMTLLAATGCMMGLMSLTSATVRD